MEIPKKKMAVIAAAIDAFLEAEQAQLRAAAEGKRRPGPTPWGLSGRQEMMVNRNLMQRKALR